MTDLISRSAVLEKIKLIKLLAHYPPTKHDAIIMKTIDLCTDAVKTAPAIDAVPVVHAHWIGNEYDGYADGHPVFDTWCCSSCGEEYCSEGEPPVCNFCPNCGARMDEMSEKEK